MIRLLLTALVVSTLGLTAQAETFKVDGDRSSRTWLTVGKVGDHQTENDLADDRWARDQREIRAIYGPQIHGLQEGYPELRSR